MEITAYTPEPCECARPRKGLKLLACYRTSRVAPGADGKALADEALSISRDIVRIRRVLMVEGMRTMTAIMRDFFEDRLEAFVERVSPRLLKRSLVVPDRKEEIMIDFGGANEGIWVNALNDVFGEQANVQLVTSYLPVAQSVAARAYERTSIIIGNPPPAQDPAVSVLRRAQGLAREVTRINDTTRAQLATRLSVGVQEGATPYEIAQKIRADIPEITAARLPTIVRTEVGRALDEGTKQAMMESGSITHCSVIGCKSREANSPTYNGQSTCNIVDVPVYDLDKLRFHPNHTGALVPSRFVGER